MFLTRKCTDVEKGDRPALNRIYKLLFNSVQPKPEQLTKWAKLSQNLPDVRTTL